MILERRLVGAKNLKPTFEDVGRARWSVVEGYYYYWLLVEGIFGDWREVAEMPPRPSPMLTLFKGSCGWRRTEEMEDRKSIAVGSYVCCW
jgi:hypothetical protein